jgi:hypothetical protein
MYFGVSLPWQRYTREQQVNSAPRLAFRVGLVDAALQPERDLHHYAALFFTQEIEPFFGYQKWSPSEFRGGFRFHVAGEQLRRQRPPSLPSYDLPPGHAAEARRMEKTRERVQALDIRALPAIEVDL